MVLTGGVQPVNTINCLAVKHPEVSVVTGKKAGTTWHNHMITYDVPTKKESKYYQIPCTSWPCERFYVLMYTDDIKTSFPANILHCWDFGIRVTLIVVTGLLSSGKIVFKLSEINTNTFSISFMHSPFRSQLPDVTRLSSVF